MDQDVVPVVAAQLRQREAGDAEDDVQLLNRNVVVQNESHSENYSNQGTSWGSNSSPKLKSWSSPVSR